MIGGSTDLQKGPGYYEGDLSADFCQEESLSGSALFTNREKRLQKPGTGQENWKKLLEQAPGWDIGFIVGVPAWIQICVEKIIDRYKLKNIHEIWPNLGFFVHGGVSFEPYKLGFEKLLGKPITYIETYLASEGFIALSGTGQDERGMRLVTSQHLFFEFVPFDNNNFTQDGEIVAKPETLEIHQVEEGRDYALLISTSAGAWRYLIGDTIRFTDKEKSEIIITGRTKHYLEPGG